MHTRKCFRVNVFENKMFAIDKRASMQVQIARIDECPQPSKIVGFALRHEASGKSMYVDAFVPLSEIEGVSESDIVTRAFERIRSSVTAFEAECSKETVVGKLVDPSTGALM